MNELMREVDMYKLCYARN